MLAGRASCGIAILVDGGRHRRDRVDGHRRSVHGPSELHDGRRLRRATGPRSVGPGDVQRAFRA